MRKYVLLAVLLCTGILQALAQQRTVTGVITDAENLPLPNATVQVKNGTAVTQTNIEGRFSISLPTGRVTLLISYVGYADQEVDVAANQNTVTVAMQSGEGMGEVVVTALGIKRDKRSIGYATSTVKGEELLQAGATLNPALAMYGKASGVGINIGSAGPTGSVNVRIRGAAGLESFARTRPLFVVDGVPIYDNATSQANTTFDPLNSLDYGTGINDINSEDIESIEILKGAKATVLYGSMGLNGVILLTTKKGRKMPGLGMNVSQQMTIEKPFTFIDFQNDYGSGAHALDTATTLINGVRTRTLRPVRFSFGPKFDGGQVMRYDSTMVPYQAHPNNFLDFFQTGRSNRTNIAISGGGAFGSARASFTHTNFTDVIDRANQKNNTFSFNGDFNVSPFARFEFTTNVYSITTRNRRPNIEQLVAWGLNRDYDYNFLRDFYLDQDGYRRELDGYALPPSATRMTGILWEQNQNTDLDKKFHTISSIRTTLRFTPNISFLGQAAVDYTNIDYTTENQITQLLPQTTGGKFQWRKQNVMVQNYQALLQWEKGFMNDDLKVLAYGGWAYQQVNESNVFAGTGENGLRFPDWYSLNNDMQGTDLGKLRGIVKGSDLMYGILGSVTLQWKDILYLQMDARKDWNSTLPSSNNNYFYPGASIVYDFTKHLNILPLKYGKLTVAFADVGGGPNVALQNRYFADNSFSVAPIYEGASVIGVFPPSALFLGDIKPFRKREIEVGLTTRWLPQNRIETEFAFYTNNIYDQIIGLNINPGTGYSTANINSANTKNWGIEITLKGAPVVTKNLRWDLTFTGARQGSKVIKLFEGIDEKRIDGINNAVRVVGKVGEAVGDIYMYDFLRDPGGNKVVNANGSYSLNTTEYIKVGNVNPKMFGGLYSDLNWKGFNLHVGIDYSYGGSVFSYSNQYLMGNGVIKATLPFRDEANGGMAYYIENGTNKKIPWQHNQPAPANAVGGIVYHDGLILPGVKEVNSGGTIKYEPNDIIISAPAHYQSYISDVSSGWPPDRIFKNNYIKLRELSIAYSIPRKISGMLKLQRLTVNVAVRNLGYIYKSIPNIDAEATLGAGSFVENSFYPAIRSFLFGINVTF
jgi:TonB-linked SusC/RagA family outer membrane protein